MARTASELAREQRRRALAAHARHHRDAGREHGPELVHGPVGAVIAAWPAASLVGSYELLVWIIRTAATGDPAL